MTRDEYIEARWQWFADRGPPSGDWSESVARERAGAAWDADHTPLAIVMKWSLDRHVFMPWRWTTSVRLIYAVALEIDEQLPLTQTGDMVCRVCSGWGEVIVELDQAVLGSAGFYRRTRIRGAEDRILTGPRVLTDASPRTLETRMVVDNCACKHTRKRPHTVQMHRIVETIAAMRSPMVDDWPERWLVDIDKRWQAEDRSPTAVWWSQFFAWTRGAEVDEQALADALEQLVQDRRPTWTDAASPITPPDAERAIESMRNPGPGESQRTHLSPDAANLLGSAGTAADVLAAVRRRLASEGIRVTGLRIDEVGVGQVHVSYDLDRIGRGPEVLRAVLAAAREAVPAGVYVTAVVRRGQPGPVRGHRHTQVVIDEIMYDATHPRSEWPFLDP